MIFKTVVTMFLVFTLQFAYGQQSDRSQPIDREDAPSVDESSSSLNVFEIFERTHKNHSEATSEMNKYPFPTLITLDKSARHIVTDLRSEIHSIDMAHFNLNIPLSKFDKKLKKSGSKSTLDKLTHGSNPCTYLKFEPAHINGNGTVETHFEATCSSNHQNTKWTMMISLQAPSCTRTVKSIIKYTGSLNLTEQETVIDLPFEAGSWVSEVSLRKGGAEVYSHESNSPF